MPVSADQLLLLMGLMVLNKCAGCRTNRDAWLRQRVVAVMHLQLLARSVVMQSAAAVRRLHLSCTPDQQADRVHYVVSRPVDASPLVLCMCCGQTDAQLQDCCACMCCADPSA